MSATAVAVMMLVGGFVWGGFLTLALKAVRSESSKTRARATAGSNGARGSARDTGVRGDDQASGG